MANNAKAIFDAAPDTKALFERGQDVRPLPSRSEALLRGGAQGATLGFADELAGASRTFGDQGDQLQAGSSPEEIVRQYREGRNQSREGDRAAQQAHPNYYLGGQIGGGLATLAIPGAGVAKGLSTGARLARAAGLGAGLGAAAGLGGSEADLTRGDVSGAAADTGVGATLGGLLGVGGEAIAQGLGSLGRALLPKVEALAARIATKVADRSASATESTARSAVGTFGKQTAMGASDLRLLKMLEEQGVTPETQAAIREALDGPEAAALREELAANGLGRFPGQLASIESSKALVEATAADAATARSPEAVAAMESQMRGEKVKVLLTRYFGPAIAGYLLGELAGGHGTLGAIAGFNARPMLQATYRALTSPGFTAPATRMLRSGAEGLAGMGEGAQLAPSFVPQTSQIAEAIRKWARPRTAEKLFAAAKEDDQ
jgi:hypothetical protein